MTNEQWLEIFKGIGKKMRDGLSIILALLMYFTRNVQWYDLKESEKPGR